MLRCREPSTDDSPMAIRRAGATGECTIGPRPIVSVAIHASAAAPPFFHGRRIAMDGGIP